jgi:hypothetical protein
LARQLAPKHLQWYYPQNVVTLLSISPLIVGLFPWFFLHSPLNVNGQKMYACDFYRRYSMALGFRFSDGMNYFI